MLAEGFEKAVVWLQADTCASDDPPTEGAKKTKTKTAAERQTEQAIRDEESGWKRCYAKAPDDDDARALISLVAKAIISPVVRRAIKLAIAHPGSVFLGEKVRALRGPRGYVVRTLTGRPDHSVNS
jgi:hypothetical protein